MAMGPSSCEIVRLPEELLATIISLTSPPDACRAAAVSRAFRAVAGSDAVWSCFLSSELPRFAEGELPRTPLPTKKAMFQHLSDTPALLPCRLTSMRLDKFSGSKCYTLSARALHISWGDTPKYWQWIDLCGDKMKTKNKRFSEVAKLLKVCWLEIRGKINSRMLSKNSMYGLYMVFKLDYNVFDFLYYPFPEASVSVGGSESTRQLCLQALDRDGPRKRILSPTSWGSYYSPIHHQIQLRDDLIFGRKRVDGWMEVELGGFYNEEEGSDEEVSVSLMQTKGGWKSGLIIRGIEIRSKGFANSQSAEN